MSKNASVSQKGDVFYRARLTEPAEDVILYAFHSQDTERPGEIDDFLGKEFD